MTAGGGADRRRVPVVLVHWNQPARLAATLDAFRDQGVDVHLLVVDNASTAAVRDDLTELTGGGDVELLAQDRNLGFGPAANVGFRRALAAHDDEWIALAPHDALPDRGTLAAMIELIEAEELRSQRRIGLACADVGDGHLPVVDPYFGGMTIVAPDRTPAPPGGRWEPADYPHGTLLLARRDCLLDIGLFDERYFAYCEEADLGLRATAAGWGVGLTRGVSVRNPTMRSGSPVVDYLMHRNTLLLVREWSGRYHAGIRLLIAVGQLVAGFRRPSPHQLAFSPRGRLLGMRDFLLGRFGPPPEDLFGAPAPDPADVVHDDAVVNAR